MVIVNIFGGLGNQMFQYATGLSLSKKLNTELQFLYKINLERTDFKLNEIIHINNVFNLSARSIPIDEFNSSLNSSKARLKNIFFNKLNINCKSSWKVYNEIAENYNEEFAKLKGNIFLNGYWQTEKYFKKNYFEIISEFQFKEFDCSNQAFLRFKNSNSVSIHIRGRDYVNNLNSNIHDVCNSNYYANSINYINQKIQSPTFYVFSDDINYAQSILKNINEKFIYVEQSEWNNNSQLDLFSMTLCKHNIIANSSFSWWGAWLNSSKNKIVCAPNVWYNDPNKQNIDIVPENWVKIKCY